MPEELIPNQTPPGDAQEQVDLGPRDEMNIELAQRHRHADNRQQAPGQKEISGGPPMGDETEEITGNRGSTS